MTKKLAYSERRLENRTSRIQACISSSPARLFLLASSLFPYSCRSLFTKSGIIPHRLTATDSYANTFSVFADVFASCATNIWILFTHRHRINYKSRSPVCECQPKMVAARDTNFLPSTCNQGGSLEFGADLHGWKATEESAIRQRNWRVWEGRGGEMLCG